MTNGSSECGRRDYRTLFLGREEELKWLQEAWKLARKGQPQIRILLAESGYGKTKIAQAFYNWLTLHHDPEHFWPGKLLHEGKDLKVMPDMSGIQDKAKMPWFWWGLRWRNPDQRNIATSISPLLTSFSDAHFTALITRLSANDHQRKALRQLALEVGAALIPGAGVAKTLYDLCKIGGEDMRRGRAATVEGSTEDKIKVILDVFSFFHDPSRGDKTSLPVVLILDDAQWIDPLSLEIIRRLWTHVRQKNLPLLILATLWEREWKGHYKPAPADDTSPHQNFARWVWQMQPPSPGSDNSSKPIQYRKLDKLPEVRILLEVAFPGLDSEQADFICRQATGNPLHIAEVIELLEGTPEWFLDNDCNKALNSKWRSFLTREQLDLQKLVSKRFKAIDQSLKDILGTASLQGPQFLEELTLQVAEEQGFCRQASQEGMPVNPLHAAEDPHALVERLDNNLIMAFRYDYIRQCAANYLEDSGKEDAVAATFAATTREWIKSGKLNKLPLNERLLLLGSSCQVAEKAQNRSDEALFIATALAQIHQSGLLLNAKEWIAYWKRLAPQAEDLRSCDFWLLWRTAELLLEVGEARQAESLTNELEDNSFLLNEVKDEAADMVQFGLNVLKGDLARQSGNLEVALKHYIANSRYLERWGESPERVPILAGMLQEVGYVEIQLGQEESALTRLRDCVKLCEQHSKQFIDSRVYIGSLASVRLALAGLEKRVGDKQNALQLYRASLGDFKKLREYFGDSVEVLFNLALALSGAADIEHQLGQQQSKIACERYNRGLQLLTQLHEKCDDPEVVRFSALLCFGSANAEWAIGNMQRAWMGYNASLETLKSMRQHIGESHQAPSGSLSPASQVYSDIAKAHLKLGDMLQALGQTQRSLDHYQRSLIIRKQLCKDYDHVSELLRDTALTILKIADVELVLGQKESSLNHYKASLQIRKQLREQFGESPQLLCNLAGALGGSDLEHALEPTRSVLERYLHSAAIRKQLHDQFAQSPEFLSDLDETLEWQADGEHELQSMQAALKPVYARLADLDQMCKQASASPEVLRETALCLGEAADMEHSLGQMRSVTALKNQQASLAFHKEVLNSFGKTAQRLSGMVQSLTRLADVEFALGHTQSALGRYKASLALLKALCEESKTPDLLRDYANSLADVASVELKLGDTQSALEHYHESLAVLEKIPHGSKQSLQVCLLRATRLEYVADLEVVLGNAQLALDHYLNSLAILDQIRDKIHDSQSGNVLGTMELLQSKIADTKAAIKFHKKPSEASENRK